MIKKSQVKKRSNLKDRMNEEDGKDDWSKFGEENGIEKHMILIAAMEYEMEKDSIKPEKFWKIVDMKFLMMDPFVRICLEWRVGEVKAFKRSCGDCKRPLRKIKQIEKLSLCRIYHSIYRAQYRRYGNQVDHRHGQLLGKIKRH